MRSATPRELMLVCLGTTFTSLGVIANTIYIALAAYNVAKLRRECHNGTR